ncbi:hypothetical protein PVNG_05849 [Plasmodium vivax North Korean]|uniref:VIR protein n=1 Tax=Plasmodium vivax North Korean TaxID=1035514 RepID=A0A0J9W6J9_PLAVI|nr:hypothetical protein PVNG_05849 [Plasmodium vivax North Korean]
MRQARFGMSSGFLKLMKGYQDINCIQKYTNYKSEIEAQINGLHTKSDSEFCRKCSIMKKDITKKNDELNECYKNNSISQPLIKVHDIKNFIDKCPTVPECLQKLLQRNKKPVAKKPESEKNCVKNNDCEPKVSSTASQTARQPPRSASETPSTRITQEQKSQNLSGQHDNRETSRAGGPTLQTLQNVRGPNKSSEPECETSKNSANDQSNTHVQAETKTRVSSPAAPEARETNTHAPGDPSQKSSDQDSESGNIFQVNDLHKKLFNMYPMVRVQVVVLPVSKLLSGSPFETKLIMINLSLQELLMALHLLKYLLLMEKRLVKNLFWALIVVRIVKVQQLMVQVLIVKGDDSEVSDSKTSGGQESNYDHPRTEGDKNRAGVDGGTDNEIPCTEGAGYRSSNNGNLCNKGERSELMDNNANALGIFSNIFGVIQDNKDNVINTSIPVGIVLLLGLLFKVN